MYNVALISNTASNNTEMIKKTILGALDNVAVTAYNSPSDFVSLTQSRTVLVDRFIIVPSGVPKEGTEEILASFFTFVGLNYPSTNVVLLANKAPLAELFVQTFVSPLMVTILLEKLTPVIFVDLVDKEVDKLVKERGYVSQVTDFESPSVLNEIVSPTPEIDPYQDEKQTKETKKKKKGFFSIFSRNKNKDVEQQTTDGFKGEGLIAPDVPVEDDINEEFELPVVSHGKDVEDIEYSIDESVEEDLVFPEDVSLGDSLVGAGGLGIGVDEVTTVTASLADVALETASTLTAVETAPTKAVLDIAKPVSEAAVAVVPKVVAPSIPVSLVPDSVIDAEISNIEKGVVLPDTKPTYDFNPFNMVEEADIEDDDGTLDFTQLDEKYQESSVVERIVEVPVEVERVVEKVVEVEKEVEKIVEVEKLVDRIVEVPVDRIVEKEVRVEVPVDRIVEKEVEKLVDRIVEVPVDRIVEKEVRVEVPVDRIVEKEVRVEVPVDRIVEKEVEKIVEVERVVERLVEVETFVGSGKRRTYKNGIRTIIVTGDRKTGVTKTALNIAAYFAKKSKTLYVDLDTKRKGSLLYLGIENIATADPARLSGVENLRVVGGLSRSVYDFDKQNFDCLLSQFGSVVDGDRIVDLQRLLLSQRDYETIVVDCPLENLPYLEDMVLYGEVFICTDSSLSSVLITMSSLVDMDFEDKGLSYLYNNSQFVISKNSSEDDFEKNLRYVNDVFSLDEHKLDWSSVKSLGTVEKLGLVLGEY